MAFNIISRQNPQTELLQRPDIFASLIQQVGSLPQKIEQNKQQNLMNQLGRLQIGQMVHEAAPISQANPGLYNFLKNKGMDLSQATLNDVQRLGPIIAARLKEKEPQGMYAFDPENPNRLSPVPNEQGFFTEGQAKFQNAPLKVSVKDQQLKEKTWIDVKKSINPFQPPGRMNSVFSRSAVANQAAARGLQVLNRPDLTWQQLNAYVNTDIAAIQRGGVPTDVQLHESNWNTLRGSISQMQSYLTGKPPSVRVPEETKNQMRGLINDIINVDNQVIEDHLDYQRENLRDFYPEKLPEFENLANRARKIKILGSPSSTGESPKLPPGFTER